ncbi:MAG: hypothetical protein ACK5MP_13865 [Nostocoides sp.]
MSALAGCSRSDMEAPATITSIRHVERSVSTPAWAGHTSRMIVSMPASMPATGSPSALIVSLHGKGGSAEDTLGLGFDAVVPETGLAIVSVDGGHGYWHRRADGRNSGALILDAAIPQAMTIAGLGP